MSGKLELSVGNAEGRFTQNETFGLFGCIVHRTQERDDIGQMLQSCLARQLQPSAILFFAYTAADLFPHLVLTCSRGEERRSRCVEAARQSRWPERT